MSKCRELFRVCQTAPPGDCAEGANCGYCHDAHHERSKKLDKRPTEGCLKHGPISLSRSGVLMIMGLIE